MKLIPLTPLLFLLPLFGGAPADKPFPLDKTIEIKELGQTFTVEGRQYVPRNVKITNLRACKIRKKGDEPAVIEVDGPLKLKALTGGRISFEDVWLEIGPECKEVTLSHVEFKGNGGIRPSEKGPGKARIFMEYVYFYGRASMTLSQKQGKVDMQSSHSDAPLTIHGARKSEKSESKLVFQMMGCKGQENGRPIGILGGMTCDGVKEILARNNDFGGQTTTFKDCSKVMFDGNNARSNTTEFHQSAYGKFGGTTIKNNDFDSQIVFNTPSKGGKAERVKLDHNWYRGLTQEDDILREMVVDNRRNAEIGVKAVFEKVCPRPLGLGGDRK